jgi:predicted Zn-dependent protease
MSSCRTFACWPLILLLLSLSAAAKDPKSDEMNTSNNSSGGINDLNAIGNRNVGCGRGVGNWYSTEKQIAMGKEYAQQVESTVKLIEDPVITEYVNRLGQNLVRNSDAKVPFTIKVIDSDEVNAFALPGGFFYVNSGLILAAENEAQLAGVMAHEIGHVAACHAAREQTRGQLVNLASIPLIFVGGGIAVYAAEEAASLAIPVTFLRFSRGFEAQADYLGVEYMYKAGYDPSEFISMFENIEAKEKKKPGFLSKAFETHPPTPDRIAKSQQEIAKVLPTRDQYIVDTSEFDDVKVRLAALENEHKIHDKQENMPTLRRAQQSNDRDDGRPTLKRRPADDRPETNSGKDLHSN